MLWVVAGVAGLVSVAPGIERAVSTPATEEAADGFVIPRSPDGQFYADARVGDVTIRFLVDAGVSGVQLAGPDAERLGLAPQAGVSVTLPQLTIGPASRNNVAARIAPALPVSLIGRDELARLGNAEIRRDRLILR